jgi:hypothetical protein
MQQSTGTGEETPRYADIAISQHSNNFARAMFASAMRMAIVQEEQYGKV